MPNPFFDHPILNSPYEYPQQYWELDDQGQPTQKVIARRRPVSFITPIPKPKKRKQAAAQQVLQQAMVFDEGQGISTAGQQYDPTPIINELRRHVDQWRALPNPSQWQVTPETARLLQHWRHHEFTSVRPFFCQVEAVETAIWLTEVAPQAGKVGKSFLEYLDRANQDANPELLRLALKLATGAGKTTVMAMVIAWQTVNAVRHPQSRRFSRGFLVVTPGLTIRDRLRVLQPNDPDSYYASRELVPADMLDDINRAKIIITNYHAFKLRERLDLSKGNRALLQGRGEPLNTLETEGQMLQRVMPDLMGLKNIMVLNDEAHHCYRERPDSDAEEDLSGEDKKEAEKNNEAARLWITGLETVKRQLGLTRVIDLSATPFFLSGSGYAEGTLFPWTMSDFSLMDAIECGIVKLPRVPVADNIPGGEMPMYRDLWQHIRTKMPKKGRSKANALDPLSLPPQLQTALDALYGHYQKTFELWEESGIGVPPCFIVVCNNTSTSKLVYDFISGFQRNHEDGTTTLEHGRLPLFRNYDDYGNPLARPNTLLIDSEQLEAGETLDDNFRAMAADEIARFRSEIIERTGDRKQAEQITDQELLREVMNTVGKPGRLGASIRCVVSVSMLTEGWDCLDGTTEILTPNGWVGCGEIAVGDDVYSLNRATGLLEIVPVLEYGERPLRADERMVRLKSQHLDIRVTEGHEFHLKYRDPRKGGSLTPHFITRTGAELLARQSSYALPLAAETAEPFLGLPLTDDELRFIAWFLTDGGFSGSKVAIVQSKEYKADIRALLERLRLSFTEQVVHAGASAFANSKPYQRFTIPKGTHTGTLARNGWYQYADFLDKDVARVLHQMTRRQFLIFWEELLKGDGEKSGNRSGWLWCSEKAQADAYTHMAVVRGLATSYHEEITTAGRTVYRVSVRDAQWITSDPADARATQIVAESPRANEVVWCIRNQNSTMITRRNGKVVILGNCNTVTHILGVRAFGTQLLCEQVVGRALRRQSYDLNDEGLFNVEYADVLGIPFDFTAKPVISPPQKPRATLQVRAMRPERDALEIRFPRVEGYRVELPSEQLTATFNADSVLELTPALVGATETSNAGIIGEGVNLNLVHTGDVRPSQVLYELTSYLVLTKWRVPNEGPKLHLFGQLKRITRHWLDTCLVCKGGTYPAQLKYKMLADMACDKITAGITRALAGEQPIKAMLDSYNPTGSTLHVNFATTKTSYWTTDSRRCHINYVILDSDWEAEFCRVVEQHPRVRAYVKNHSLGFEVPYRYGSETRKYRPDFIVLVDDGHGDDDLLHLVIEIKGYRGEDAREKKSTMETYWIPGVNNLGQYGRWAFAEFTQVYEIEANFAAKVANSFDTVITNIAVE
jgi:hypothetical protein